MSENAKVAFESGDFVKARSLIEQSIQIAPSDVGLYQQRASIRFKQKDLVGAISDLSKVMDIEGKSDKVLAARAMLYAESGNFDQAIEDLDDIGFDMPIHELQSCRGVVYLHFEKYREARAAFEDSLKLKPDPRNFFGRGQAEFKLGELDRAFLSFSMVIELDPGEPSGYLARARVSDVLGYDFAAKSDRSKVQQILKNPPNIFEEQ